MPARDALGRPVASGSPAAVEPVEDRVRTPREALQGARELLAVGRAFSAHEVFEGMWKAAPAADRALWQGLAQLCVGLTHLQRGNRLGAARLLRRGADNLAGQPSGGVVEPARDDLARGYGLDLARVRADAVRLAGDIEAGRPWAGPDLTSTLTL